MSFAFPEKRRPNRYFLWEEKLEGNLKMDTIRAFFSKNTFFDLEKGRRGLPLSHLVARL